jgi:hypothetical protein
VGIDPPSRKLSFPFRRVFPSGLLRLSGHVPNSGYERVQQARIVTLARNTAEVIAFLC